MAGREREVRVTVLGDSSRGQKALRDLGDDADRADSKFGKLGGGISAFSKHAVGALAGIGIATAVGGFLKGSIEEAEETRKVMAQTNAVIASTGGVAKVSAADVDSLASSLSAMSGIDDEVIASGENLLLTFTNVRNETGKGNDVFNQATKAALNMSVALGTDMNSASMLVGKALNDPIKGMTAMTRAGIQFSEQQKDQIKTMVESGNVLGAQKIILKELETQFGGSAAAAASPMARLKVAFGNLQEQVGAALLPALAALATFLADKLPAVAAGAARVFRPIADAFKGLLDLFIRGDFTGALRRAFNVEEDSPVVDWLFRIRDAAIGLFRLFVQGDFTGAFRRAFNVEEDSPLVDALFRIREAAFSLFGFVRENLQPILIALGVAFALIVSPIGAVIAALIYAYTQFEGFRNIVNAVVSFLTETVVPAIAVVASFIAEQFGALVGWVQTHWGSIQEAIGHVIVAVQAIVEVFVGYISMLWRTFGDEIVAVAIVVWDQIRNVIETVVNLVRGIIEVGLALINGEWGAAWDGIKRILATAWEFIRETVVNALRLLGQAVEGGLSAIVGVIGGLPGRALGALGSLGGYLFGAGQDLIWGMVDGIWSMARRLADAAVSVVRSAVNAAKSFLGIGSPSKLFMGFGVNLGEGLALGMGQSERGVGAAATSLAGAAIPGLADLTLSNAAPSAASGGAATSATPTVIVHVHGTVTTAHGLAEDVRAEMLKMQRRVPSLGYT